MVSLTLEDRMRTVRFVVDEVPHIRIHPEICRECDLYPCVCACPANLFTRLADGGMLYNHEQCLECGTCYVICERDGAIDWSYPRGGSGVCFRES